MSQNWIDQLETELGEIRQAGLYKSERVIHSPQSAHITTNGAEVANFCANNYLGLANEPALIQAAKAALDSHGFGMASVRFICGTQDLHKQLEAALADYLGTEDCILFASCFDANAGVFEPLLSAEDAILSDALNHASIIDGVRLCKAQRFRYHNNDMDSLEAQLKAANGARRRLIVTDGVFSMDGTYANLPAISALAERYDAWVMVDDCHATGFVGKTGAGTPEHFGVQSGVQLLSGTLGKALGGASGGYIAGPRAVVELLRQKARTYLFSNAVAPPICAASLKAIELARSADQRRAQLWRNAALFRKGLTQAGFELVQGEHAIIPVMIGDAALAAEMAQQLLAKGVYVIAFSYPVVPKGTARIRTQMSAIHTETQIEQAVAAFTEVGQSLGVVSV